MAKLYAIKELNSERYLVVNESGKIDMNNPVLSDKPITYFYPAVAKDELVIINDHLKNVEGVKFVMVELTERVVEDENW